MNAKIRTETFENVNADSLTVHLGHYQHCIDLLSFFGVVDLRLSHFTRDSSRASFVGPKIDDPTGTFPIRSFEQLSRIFCCLYHVDSDFRSCYLQWIAKQS